jgi:hypothetical protein
VGRYGMSMGDGPRFEMYLYVADLEGMVRRLADADVRVLREHEHMPWGDCGRRLNTDPPVPVENRPTPARAGASGRAAREG